MSDITKVTFSDDDYSLDIFISKEDKNIWLSRKDLASLFNKSIATISRHIKELFDENCKKVGYLFAENAKKSNSDFGRPTELFNIEVIMLLSKKYHSNRGEQLQTFLNTYIMEDSGVQTDSNIIKYNNGNISIDVNVSPEEETVWLNVAQIASLFDVSKDNVYLHIKNIIKEGELENTTTEESSYIDSVVKKSLNTDSVIEKNSNTDSVYKDNLYTDRTHKENLYVLPTTHKENLYVLPYTKKVLYDIGDGRKYSVDFYNLDMILAIGYRVKSNRAIQFRRWASEVLKKYMMTGYVVDKDRAVVTTENFNGLVDKVNSLSNEINEIKETMYIKPLKERLFFNGEFFDAYEFICDLMSSASRRLIIIDPYFDYTCFKYLKKVNKSVEVVVVLSFKKGNVTNADLAVFKKQYFPIRLVYTEDFHNRFIIIDDVTCYDIGTSLNHMGKGIFAIHKMEEDKITKILLEAAK